MPSRRKLDEDQVSYFLRLTLYATCIVLPFIALMAGRIDADEGVTVALTLMAALGPAVALSRTTTEQKVKRDAYADGLETGLERDDPPHGRHRLDEGH